MFLIMGAPRPSGRNRSLAEKWDAGGNIRTPLCGTQGTPRGCPDSLIVPGCLLFPPWFVVAHCSSKDWKLAWMGGVFWIDFQGQCGSPEVVPEYLRIRGYRMNRLEERSFKFDQPGEYCIDEPSLWWDWTKQFFKKNGLSSSFGLRMVFFCLLRVSQPVLCFQQWGDADAFFFLQILAKIWIFLCFLAVFSCAFFLAIFGFWKIFWKKSWKFPRFGPDFPLRTKFVFAFFDWSTKGSFFGKMGSFFLL